MAHCEDYGKQKLLDSAFITRPIIACVMAVVSVVSLTIFSCKKALGIMETKPDVSELKVVAAKGKKLPEDVDISDLIAIWAKTMPAAGAPQFQDPFEAAPRIVREFAGAGKAAGISSGGTQVWFGIGFCIPPTGKATIGWYILRLETPHGKVDGRVIQKLKALNLIDESAVASKVAFHCEYRSSDWDTVKKIVEGMPVPDDHPFIRDLRTLRGRGPYPMASTAGVSSVVIHDRPLVEPPVKNHVPLYLRQKGNRMYGIQRTKTGDSSLPFEHITGIYYEFWRVR